jgi:hypothetical protein
MMKAMSSRRRQPARRRTRADLTLLFPNPYTLDAAGRIPQFFLADGSIKIKLIDKHGTTLGYLRRYRTNECRHASAVHVPLQSGHQPFRFRRARCICICRLRGKQNHCAP